MRYKGRCRKVSPFFISHYLYRMITFNTRKSGIELLLLHCSSKGFVLQMKVWKR